MTKNKLAKKKLSKGMTKIRQTDRQTDQFIYEDCGNKKCKKKHS